MINKNLFAFCDKIYKVNASNWKTLSKNFIITTDCIECGYCEKICPTSNIVISDGNPSFQEKCVSCLACYQRCSKKAINYGKRTIGKRRYFNPNIDFTKMN